MWQSYCHMLRRGKRALTRLWESNLRGLDFEALVQLWTAPSLLNPKIISENCQATQRPYIVRTIWSRHFFKKLKQELKDRSGKSCFSELLLHFLSLCSFHRQDPLPCHSYSSCFTFLFENLDVLNFVFHKEVVGKVVSFWNAVNLWTNRL